MGLVGVGSESLNSSTLIIKVVLDLFSDLREKKEKEKIKTARLMIHSKPS